MSPHSKLFQAPFAVSDALQEAGVAEDLQLLSNLIADMRVVGMEFFQFGGEGVYF